MNEVKILLLGLDNSGKTSLILNLQDKVNLSHYTSIIPTKKTQIREVIIEDSKYAIWDIGGQKTFRDEFLKKIDDFTPNTDKIIYLIDVRDQARYEVALNYLEEVLKVFKKQKIFIKISIFLHKYDPDVELNKEGINNLIMELQNRIPKEFEYEIFKTGLYTMLYKSLVIL